MTGMKEVLVRTAGMMAVILLCGVSFATGWRLSRRAGEGPAERPDTVRVVKWLHDTVEVESSRPAGTVTAYLPVVQEEQDATEIERETDLLARETDSVAQDATEIARPDTVLVEVPIEEKTVAGENYRAVLRGYRPELVDIWVKQIRVPYRKRWSVTAGPQVGVGITPDGWRPYAGIGVTFGYSF